MFRFDMFSDGILINVADVGPRGSLSDVGWFMSQMSFRIASGHLKAGPIGKMSWP